MSQALSELLACLGARVSLVGAEPLTPLSLLTMPLRLNTGVFTMLLLDLRRAAVRLARIGSNSQGEDPRSLRSSKWALPCVRTAPNSQSQGPKNPAACHATPVASPAVGRARRPKRTTAVCAVSPAAWDSVSA